MEGRKDKRERRSIQAQMNMAKSIEFEIFEFHVQRKQAGRWKSDFVNAITLYRDLLLGQVDVLRDLFPRIVDAVRLFLAIENGDLSVMKELFPNRYELFRLQLEADILEGINQDTQRDLLKELRSIKAEIATLKESGFAPAPADNGGIKSIGGLRPVAAPSFDDEDDMDLFGVRKDENAGLRASNNFLASLSRVQGMKPSE